MEDLNTKLKEFGWNVELALEYPEYFHVTAGKGYILWSRFERVEKHAATLRDVKGFLQLLRKGEPLNFPKAKAV